MRRYYYCSLIKVLYIMRYCKGASCNQHFENGVMHSFSNNLRRKYFSYLKFLSSQCLESCLGKRGAQDQWNIKMKESFQRIRVIPTKDELMGEWSERRAWCSKFSGGMWTLGQICTVSIPLFSWYPCSFHKMQLFTCWCVVKTLSGLWKDRKPERKPVSFISKYAMFWYIPTERTVAYDELLLQSSG